MMRVLWAVAAVGLILAASIATSILLDLHARVHGCRPTTEAQAAA